MIRHDRSKHASIFSNNTEYCYDKQSTVGFIDFIEWYSSEWTQPKEAGRYYTSDSNGVVQKLYRSSIDKPIYKLIFPILSVTGGPIWSDGTELTDSEIVAVCSKSSVWYDYESVEDYGEYFGDRLVIISEKDQPAYWADFDRLTGPTKYDIDHSPIHIEPSI